jgi:hypothetical protein
MGPKGFWLRKMWTKTEILNSLMMLVEFLVRVLPNSVIGEITIIKSYVTVINHPVIMESYALSMSFSSPLNIVPIRF